MSDTLGRFPRCLALFSSGLFLTTACGRPEAPPSVAVANPASPAYSPGLGEIMSLQQMRHTKLWLAGRAENWELAAYEIEELGEGFDDVVRLHPTHKDSPVALRDAIPTMVNEPLAEVRRAIEQRDAPAFNRAYDAFTGACNRCHEATNFGFNRVRRPATNPHPNQVFEPVRR